MNEERPFGVSVIIPARNEARFIRSCILSIIEGTGEHIPLEILVIDGMSTDETPVVVQEIAKEYPCVKLMKNSQFFTQYALNIGLQAASYAYVLIAGAHAKYPPAYVDTLLEWLEHHGGDGAGGVLETVVQKDTRIGHAIAAVLQCRLGVGNSLFRVGVRQPVIADTIPFGLYPYQVFKQVGFYHTALKRNHDIEWSKRAARLGKRFWLLPSLKCQYFARHTLKDLAKNNFQNGMWNIVTVFVTRRLDSLSWRHYVPLFFVGGLLVLLLLSLLWFPAFVLFILLSLSYLFVVGVQAILLSLKHGSTTFFHIFLVFIVLHFSYGFGSLIGIFKGAAFLLKHILQND